MKRIIKIQSLVMAACLSCCIAACDSLDNTITEDPYGGGKEPINIKLLSDAPKPDKGYPGDTVVFKARGLMDLYDATSGEFRFKFYMNEVETPVSAATDSTLTVVVPENISTGLTYLVAENQVFYGPAFTVLGNLAIDESFGLSGSVINGAVCDYLESRYSGSPYNFYLVGKFDKIGNTSYNGLVFINQRGTPAGQNTANYKTRYGFEPSNNFVEGEEGITSISYFADGQMLLSGAFSSYYVDHWQSTLMKGYQVPTDNVVILENNAALDTTRYVFNELINSSPNYQPLNSFNGGTNAPVKKSFVTSDQKVVLVGNFRQYFSTIPGSWYSESTQAINDITCVVRAERDGTLDETYRNVDHGYTGIAGGSISDAYMDSKDNIVIVGDFTSFDGYPAPGIVRLDPDGNVDESYMAAIGKGADNSIFKVRYNPTLHKVALAGSFNSFNGQPRAGIALLNEDGSLDEQFVPRRIEGGGVDFATLLNCNKIVASGSFRLYDGVPRQGFVVLEPDGEAIQRYNVTGEFSGELNQVVETVTSIGNYGLLLLGDITRFNGKPVNNAVMLEADFNDDTIMVESEE